MELREFIAGTLADIQAGVQAAINQTIASQTNGAINPCWGTTKDIGASLIQQVRFDIAVTVLDKVAGSAEAGIKVVGIGLGAEKQDLKEQSHVSRIQFSVPIIPPVTTIGRSE